MIRKFINRNKIIFGLFCFCLFTAFLINFPLSKIPPIINYGYEFGKFTYDVSIGYIVSTIFYFLVVFLKEEKDKQNINLRVSLQSSFIILEGYSLFSMAFSSAPIYKNRFPPSFDEMEKACLRIDPFISPIQKVNYNSNNSSNTSWQYLLRSHREEVLNHLAKINSLPYIDSELLGITTRFEDCNLYYIATNYIFPTHKVEHFKDGYFMVQSLYDYFVLVDELEKYVDKNYNEFENHIKLRTERKKLYFIPRTKLNK